MSKQTFAIIGLLVVVLATLRSPVQGQKSDSEMEMLTSAKKLYLVDHNFVDALNLLNRIIKKYPRSRIGFFMRGEVEYLLRDWDNALADTNQAIRLNPKALGIEAAYSNRGYIYDSLGKTDESFADFEKAFRLNPNYGPALNGLGVTLVKKNRFDDALLMFERDIQLHPEDLLAYDGRGDLRFRKRDFQGSVSDYSKVLDRGMEYPAAWVRRGFAYGMLGRWQSAIADLKNGFKSSNTIQNRFSGGLDVSFSDLDTYITNNPKDSKGYAMRGFVNLFRNRDLDAERDFKTSFILDEEIRSRITDLMEFVKKIRATE